MALQDPWEEADQPEMTLQWLAEQLLETQRQLVKLQEAVIHLQRIALERFK